MILFVTDGKPSPSPTNQHPNAERITWVSPTGKAWVVDYTGLKPTDDEVRQLVEPTQAEVDASEKLKVKSNLRGKDMRALRAVARVLVKKMPGYTWQQFLADFDAIIDND